jgi:DNA mismatch repair ATPase MutS
VDAQHPYSYDLDIFGPYSLFQMLNRGQTSIGQRTLAQWLMQPAPTAAIAERQAAARELARDVDWQHHLRAMGAALRETDGQIDRILDWLQQPNIVLGRPMRRAALWVAPVLFVVAMVLWATVLPWFIALLLLLPAGIWLRNSLEEVQQLHLQTARVADTLRSYASLVAHIESASWTVPHLVALQAHFRSAGVPASVAIRKLAYRVSQLDVRYNAFVFLLEFSVVWDLQQAYRLDKWKAQHRDHLPHWFTALADIEALVSLGNLHINHPDWAFPTLTTDRQLTAQAMGHPLLPAGACVTNDMASPTQGHIHLLTGSNMAGKSTWLRTVGTNIVLALAGAPVRAEALRLPQMQVYTSMRTQDALHESTSSFYAELKRLKFIIEAVEDPSITDGRPVFFLLDEILKGTNSRDRHTGAKALIRQLIASQGAGIIATHDLELGVLEAEANGQIENWAIEVTIQDGKLYFDYLLKKGVSKSFNATLLMQQMGIRIA